MDGKGTADALAKKGSAEEAAHFKKVEAEQLAKIKAQKEAADKEKKQRMNTTGMEWDWGETRGETMMAGDKTKRDESGYWLGVGQETERWGRSEFVDEVTDERGSTR